MVVGIEECLHTLPCALDCVRMSPSAHIKETDVMVDGLMCVAVRFEVTVRRTALTAHYTAID